MIVLREVCTCDDNCDSPCPRHKIENELVEKLHIACDERNEAQLEAAELQHYIHQLKNDLLEHKDCCKIQADTDKPLSDHGKQLSYYVNKRALKSILNIALDIHMVRTGAMDYYEKYLKDISLLKWSINNWKLSPHSEWKVFDDCVKAVIESALRDFEYSHTFLFCDWLDISVLDDPEYFLNKEKM